MSVYRPAASIALLLCVVCSGGVCAKEPYRASDILEVPYTGEETVWQEQSLPLPPYPALASLRALDLGVHATSVQQVLLDIDTLHLGTDGVLRYVLVIKTAGGAINTQYEGMRCETRETRLYAVGDHAQTWRALPHTAWKPIVYNSHLPLHSVLARDYFCEAPHQALPVDLIRKRLAYPASRIGG
jgi:hypothetical protein